MGDLIGQFVSNLILLLIGGFITYYTVNRYQKNKDYKMIRENLVKIHAESLSNLMAFLRAWNKYFGNIDDLMQEANDDDEIKLPSSEEVYVAIHEFDFKRRLLLGKILIHLQLNEHQAKSFSDLDLQFSKMGIAVEHILENTIEELLKNNTFNWKEDIAQFLDLYTGLIDILLSAEIKE